MLTFIPLLMALAYGLVIYHVSAYSTARQLDAQSSPLQDPALLRITDQLAQALDLPRIHVHIHEVDAINGLAAPDGRIFITRGFYNRFRDGSVTGAELASVIAHELGHVALGHSRRRMIDFSSQNALRSALAIVFNRIIPGLGGMLAGLATRLLAARLSRDDEFEADAYATALMIKSGLGATPQISLFEKLPKLTGHGGAAMPAWFLSHPKADERISAIRGNVERWQPNTP